MTALDLHDELRRRPFVPFRVFVSDGSEFHIRHPDQRLVLVTSVIVGVAGLDNALPFDGAVRIG